MKIAALSPQFVIESSTAAEGSEAKRTSHKLGRLRLVQTEGTSPASADSGDSTGPDSGGHDQSEEDLEKETREGIKRLSRLIHRHARPDIAAKTPPVERKGGPSFDAEFKKRKAIAIYQDLAEFKDPLNSKGLQLDILY